VKLIPVLFDNICATMTFKDRLQAAPPMRVDEEPKNGEVNNLVLEVAHARKRNPLSNLDEILQDGR